MKDEFGNRPLDSRLSTPESPLHPFTPSPPQSVLIVGAGVVGLCVAYYLLRKGHQITLLERGAPDHDGCSLGNAGMVVPSHFVPLAAPGMVGLGLRMMRDPESPFALRPRLDPELLQWGWRFYRSANAAHVARSAPLLRDLHLASRRLFEELSAESGNAFGLTQNGLLMLCKTEQALHEEAELAEKARGLGIPAEILSQDEAGRLDPGIRMDIAGAVYFPLDCHLSPARLMAWLSRAVQEAGAEISWCTEATGWRVGQGRVEAVLTNRGEMRADEFIVTGGAWSGVLAHGLGLRLPMQAGKGYSLTLPKPRQLPRICSILTEARVAVTPMGDSLRFAGTMEIAGLDRTIQPSRMEGILKSIPRYFPDFRREDFQSVPVWCGLRPCSPDGLPYVGRTRRYTNLSIAAGHAMMGVSLAPITGKLISQILSGEPPSIGIDLLRPDRFG